MEMGMTVLGPEHPHPGEHEQPGIYLLETGTKVLGPEHPDILTTMNIYLPEPGEKAI